MRRRTHLIAGAVLLLAGVLAVVGRASAQELTPDQRAWLRGHASDPSIAGGWAHRATEARLRREVLRRAGLPAARTVAEAARAGTALAGTVTIPVLAVTYRNVEPPFPAETLAAALFDTGPRNSVTITRYYTEMSQGALLLTGRVTPWIVLDSAASWYLPASSYGWPNRGRLAQWWNELLGKADRLVDFAAFDNDGPDGIPNSGDDDGVVDLLWVMYATDCHAGADWRDGFLWPGGGSMYYQTSDPAAGGGTITIGPMVFMNAQNRGLCEAVGSGVLAHETGHAFGLPDLYDYDFSSNGVGNWDLMGYGLYNTERIPAYLGAYCREQLGWITVADLAAGDSAVVAEPTELVHQAYRFATGGVGEYFLLENRAPLGTDLYLPGAGLLVWHIDPSVPGNSDEVHKRVDVEEADGLRSLDLRQNFGDPGDLFPAGSLFKTRFNATTEPNSRIYSGAASGLAIYGITLHADRTVSFHVLGNAIAITTDSLRTATMGSAYAEQLTAETDSAPAIWMVVAGSPPPGIVVSAPSGSVTGVPERAGQFSFTVRAVAAGATAERMYSLSVVMPALAFDSVVAHLMGAARPLTPDQLRFLDLLGNHNDRFDLGDFLAWLDATGNRSRRAARLSHP